jgi:hypothetical protein
MMNRSAYLGLALSVVVCASGTSFAAKRVDYGTAPTAAQPAPSQPNAPLQGEITSVDAGKNLIGINRQNFAIGSPLLALLDRRPNATGLLDLAALRPGMVVRYRTVPDGAMTRVVELWVMRDAPERQQ